MEICPRHRQYLDDALRLRNLQGLFSPSQEETDLKVQEAIACGLTLDNFDPQGLMQVAIEMQARRVLTNTGRQPQSPPRTCILCWLNEGHRVHCSDPRRCRFTYDSWIAPAADNVVELWEDLNC